MSDEQAQREAGGAVFTQDDVVASYYARPPYAPALYEHLLRQVPGRRRALDIGCGPGKVTRELAGRFGEVVAVDPSPGMIAAARAAPDAPANITWLQSRAEDYDDAGGGGFDLVTAGASIHWTDPAVLFPKLARWTPVIALLNDAPIFPLPPPPCGHDAWIEFLEVWFQRTGRAVPAAWRTPDPAAWSSLRPHGDWIDVAGRERFAFSFRQSVEDFIVCCHSRVSWNRQMMGDDVAAAFDAALDALMRPFSVEGMLELDVVSELTWGRPRPTPQ
jgi:SAM-dependent methyltransferase